MTNCKYGDPICPCQDGDACHYEGADPMNVPPEYVRRAVEQARMCAAKPFSHPMQRVYLDNEGVIRFVHNQIVQFLLDEGPFDMNHLAVQKFSEEDRVQFAQLVGYSVSGFGGLDYVSRKALRKADRRAEKLMS